MNILIIGDPDGNDDEGMKRVNNNLRKEINSLGHSCTIGKGISFKENKSQWDKVVFTAGPTTGTLFKMFLIRLLNRKSELIACGLMPSIKIKQYKLLSYCLDKIVSQNPKMLRLAKLNNIPVIKQTASTFCFDQFLRGRERVKPKRSGDKLRLLHVGHLNKKRNVYKLALLCNKIDASLTFLISSTEKPDPEERKRLESIGVEIVSGYQQDLYTFYRQFDLYAFPVQRSDAAISMPLSVIEALLAGLNVLSTDFGEISNYFEGSECVKIVDNLENITASQLENLAAHPVINISKLSQFETKNLAKLIVVSA